MINSSRVSSLRAAGWSGLPSTPGVYWWYFPRTYLALDHFRVTQKCNASLLSLRNMPDGMVCLYHGMANNLTQRIAWHAAQKLTTSSLRSRFLSTLRFTLLALNDFDYFRGTEQINGYFDELVVGWLPCQTREEAEEVEQAELLGNHHYPRNIKGNRKPELAGYIRYLKDVRKSYRNRYVKMMTESPADVSRECGAD